jgi:hypothetical protein
MNPRFELAYVVSKSSHPFDKQNTPKLTTWPSGDEMACILEKG